MATTRPPYFKLCLASCATRCGYGMRGKALCSLCIQQWEHWVASAFAARRSQQSALRPGGGGSFRTFSSKRRQVSEFPPYPPPISGSPSSEFSGSHDQLVPPMAAMAIGDPQVTSVTARIAHLHHRRTQGARRKTENRLNGVAPALRPAQGPEKVFSAAPGRENGPGAVFGRKKIDQGQFYARSIIKVHEVAPRSDTFLVEFLSPAGGGDQPAGTKGEVMPWIGGKNCRFCFAS